LRRRGLSVRQIASELGRAHTTISREIRRNSCADGGYRPFKASHRTRGRRSRSAGTRIARDVEHRRALPVLGLESRAGRRVPEVEASPGSATRPSTSASGVTSGRGDLCVT
jgi:hypothetical protein